MDLLYNTTNYSQKTDELSDYFNAEQKPVNCQQFLETDLKYYGENTDFYEINTCNIVPHPCQQTGMVGSSTDLPSTIPEDNNLVVSFWSSSSPHSSCECANCLNSTACPYYESSSADSLAIFPSDFYYSTMETARQNKQELYLDSYYEQPNYHHYQNQQCHQIFYDQQQQVEIQNQFDHEYSDCWTETNDLKMTSTAEVTSYHHSQQPMIQNSVCGISESETYFDVNLQRKYCDFDHYRCACSKPNRFECEEKTEKIVCSASNGGFRTKKISSHCYPNCPGNSPPSIRVEMRHHHGQFKHQESLISSIDSHSTTKYKLLAELKERITIKEHHKNFRDMFQFKQNTVTTTNSNNNYFSQTLYRETTKQIQIDHQLSPSSSNSKINMIKGKNKKLKRHDNNIRAINDDILLNINNICFICGKNYARPSTLKTHLRTHSGEKPFRCQICTKAFSQAANLTAHIRTHSGEKPFPCPICKRRFSQSSSVTTHLRTHSGERPYCCQFCRKAFSDSSTLTKHLRIHSGDKPYNCIRCGLRFSQSGNLNRHMRVHM